MPRQKAVTYNIWLLILMNKIIIETHVYNLVIMAFILYDLQ